MRLHLPILGIGSVAILVMLGPIWQSSMSIQALPERFVAAILVDPARAAEPQSRVGRTEDPPLISDPARAAEPQSRVGRTEDPPLILDEAGQREQARLALLHLEENFAKEVPNPSTSQWVRNEVRRALKSGSVAGMQIDTSKCGATLCRLEFVFDDEDTLLRLAKHLPFILPTQGGSAWFIDPTDFRRIVLFAQRKAN